MGKVGVGVGQVGMGQGGTGLGCDRFRVGWVRVG